MKSDIQKSLLVFLVSSVFFSGISSAFLKSNPGNLISSQNPSSQIHPAQFIKSGLSTNYGPNLAYARKQNEVGNKFNEFLLKDNNSENNKSRNHSEEQNHGHVENHTEDEVNHGNHNANHHHNGNHTEENATHQHNGNHTEENDHHHNGNHTEENDHHHNGNHTEEKDHHHNGNHTEEKDHHHNGNHTEEKDHHHNGNHTKENATHHHNGNHTEENATHENVNTTVPQEKNDTSAEKTNTTVPQERNNITTENPNPQVDITRSEPIPPSFAAHYGRRQADSATNFKFLTPVTNKNSFLDIEDDSSEMNDLLSNDNYDGLNDLDE
jgi:hypothetical protein